jgi:alpha-tubulin suppressor-like RCC1 family protein
MSRSNTLRHAALPLVLALIGWLVVSAGFTTIVGVPDASATTSGALYAWGVNNAGQLGDGTGTDAHSPELISLASGVTPTAISSGTYDSLAIGSDGNLYAWGENGNGQLGDGTTTNLASPEVITLAPGVTPTAISAAPFHSLAIGSDGQLYAWGDNDQGELGDGTTTEHDSPEVITLAPGVTPTAIAAGYYDNLVIGSDGNLYAWGYNEIGQLGDGTTTERDSPEVITLAPGVTPTDISAVYFHSMAIGSDGNLYAWGDNINGQLGDGTNTNRPSPEVITLAAGVTPTTISAGGLYSLAIGSDGQLYAWGDNTQGELGDGTTAGQGSPELITLAPGVTPTAEISAGYDHALDVGSDGHLYAWGQNNVGQLGDGTTSDHHSPEVITLASGGTPAAISAGFEHSMAVGLGSVAATAPRMTTQPTNDTYPNGGSVAFTATASGIPTPTEQWQYSANGGTNWANLTGATSPTFSASGLNALENGWQIRAVFSNSVGSTTSDAATMSMAPSPVVTTQPSNQSYTNGGSIAFAAAASGTPTPTVQWQYSANSGTTWANLTGATSPTFSASGLNALENGWQVRAVFTNTNGSATSHAATMTLTSGNSTPVVTTQPSNQNYANGGSVSFTAAASGTPPPTVQWQYSANSGTSWANLTGATSPTFSASGLNALENGWQVRAVFTNSAGSATSHAATMRLT